MLFPTTPMLPATDAGVWSGATSFIAAAVPAAVSAPPTYRDEDLGYEAAQPALQGLLGEPAAD